MNTCDFTAQSKPLLITYLETETSIFDSHNSIHFDQGTLEYHRGSTCLNSATITKGDGIPVPILAIITAPESAWIAGDTSPWESWIWFHDRAGAKAAHRLARWLLRGDPSASLTLLSANFGVVACDRHMEQPCWKRFNEAAPTFIELMPTAEEEA